MAGEKPTRCPRCQESPEKIDTVRESTQAGFGSALPEPKVVERATCKNGHRWYARDEPDSGDAVIVRKDGVSIVAYGLVLDDGIIPKDLKTGTLSEAEKWAEGAVAETAGRVRVIDRS